MEIVILLELIQYKHTPPITSTAHRTKISFRKLGTYINLLTMFKYYYWQMQIKKI